MSGINKVILIGNLGKDPEVRYLEGGVAVARFSLATTEIYKDKNGNRVEHTEWHTIVVWRGLAEITEKLLKKGVQIYLEGRLRTRPWEDKQGVKHYKTEIVGDTFTILNRREPDNKHNEPQTDENNPISSSSNQPTNDLGS